MLFKIAAKIKWTLGRRAADACIGMALFYGCEHPTAWL